MKKSNFIFYWIELAVRRGRRRELEGGGGCFTRHALKGKTSNLNLPRLSVKLARHVLI